MSDHAAVGNNPTDRGKKGSKRSLLVEQHGLPTAIQINGPNRHDVKLLAQTLDATVVTRPQGDEASPQHCVQMPAITATLLKPKSSSGIIPHILFARRGASSQAKGKQARRWVVEVAFSWLNRFRKLLVRFEKKACNYEALLHFACASIVWRKVIPVHSR